MLDTMEHVYANHPVCLYIGYLCACKCKQSSPSAHVYVATQPDCILTRSYMCMFTTLFFIYTLTLMSVCILDTLVQAYENHPVSLHFGYVDICTCKPSCLSVYKISWFKHLLTTLSLFTLDTLVRLHENHPVCLRIYTSLPVHINLHVSMHNEDLIFAHIIRPFFADVDEYTCKPSYLSAYRTRCYMYK